MSETTPQTNDTVATASRNQRASQLAQALRQELHKAVIGQHEVVEGLLTALIAGGHVLVEAFPVSARHCWYAPWHAASAGSSHESSSPRT